MSQTEGKPSPTVGGLTMPRETARRPEWLLKHEGGDLGSRRVLCAPRPGLHRGCGPLRALALTEYSGGLGAGAGSLTAPLLLSVTFSCHVTPKPGRGTGLMEVVGRRGGGQADARAPTFLVTMANVLAPPLLSSASSHLILFLSSCQS